MTYAPSEDSDQPEHPLSLIRVSAVRMKDSWVLNYPLFAQQRLWLVLVDAQADLSLRWVLMSFCWFCRTAAKIGYLLYVNMSRLMTKRTKWHVRPAKTQISLGIRPVWSEPLLCTQWVAKDLSFLHAHSEGSDQTGRTPRLIWVFAGRTCHVVGFVMRRLNYHYWQFIKF